MSLSRPSWYMRRRGYRYPYHPKRYEAADQDHNVVVAGRHPRPILHLVLPKS